MEAITKDMTIQQVLEMDEGTVPVFLSFGMSCLGCPMSRMESIADACQAHGIDSDALVGKLDSYFKEKN